MPEETAEEDNRFLRRKFLESFNYTKNARLAVTFQRFDKEWGNDNDKLKVVVSPSLSDPCSTEDTIEVRTHAHSTLKFRLLELATR